MDEAPAIGKVISEVPLLATAWLEQGMLSLNMDDKTVPNAILDSIEKHLNEVDLESNNSNTLVYRAVMALIPQYKSKDTQQIMLNHFKKAIDTQRTSEEHEEIVIRDSWSLIYIYLFNIQKASKEKMDDLAQYLV